MAKYLISYKSAYATGKQSVMYHLTVINIKFFGIIRRKYIIQIELNQFHSFKQNFDLWDELISTKQKL